MIPSCPPNCFNRCWSSMFPVVDLLRANLCYLQGHSACAGRRHIWTRCWVWNHRGGTVTPLHCSEHRRGLIGEYRGRLQVSECIKGGEQDGKRLSGLCNPPPSFPFNQTTRNIWIGNTGLRTRPSPAWMRPTMLGSDCALGVWTPCCYPHRTS